MGLLLATSSVAALVAGGSGPARAACVVITGPSAGFTNPVATTIDCITVTNATVNGNIVNAGTITPGGPTGIAILDSSLFNGAVLNSGTISANQTGISVFNVSTFTAGIANTGTINASQNGIFVNNVGTFAGGIGNTGTITAGSGGIVVGSPCGCGLVSNFSGGIGNSGTISATGTGIGVFGVSTFSGGIANIGTISAGSAGIVVAGVSAFSGGIGNSGTISVSGTGIVVAGVATYTGGIANAGTITSSSGAGILVIGVQNFSGGINNSGTISALSANGIFVAGVSAFSGGIANSGTISASSVGIVVTGVATFSGGIANSGTISASSAGIVVAGVSTFSGGIANSGTIAAGSSGIVVAGVATFSGGIRNSGTISASSVGILVTDVSAFSGGISNSGTISSAGVGIAVGSICGCGGVSTFAGGIANSGTITGGTAGIAVSNVGTFLGGITNSGLVAANGGFFPSQGGIIVQVVGSFAGGIANEAGGTISVASGVGIGVAFVSNFSGGIRNAGTILSNSASAISINFVSTFSGGITNSGTIQTSNFSGAAISINAVETFLGGVTNTGSITSSGIGIAIGDCFCGISIFSGDVVNTGTITGAAGIFITGVATFLGGIVNSGTITGTSSFGVFANSPISVTNSGTISGLLAIELDAGGSSIFNSGTIIGTGGTAVTFAGAGNTLTLGPGSVINGLVLASGSDTFQLGGSGADSFDAGLIGPSAQYQGFSTFNKVGNSTWTLTGTNTLTLPWTVFAGTLNVTGSLPNSPFTVQAGTLSVDGTVGPVTLNAGLLTGNGTLGGLTVNGGTVSPGHSIGTLNVAGNASFGVGSFYRVETTAGGQSDLIRVGGTTTLTGGTVQALPQIGAYGASTTYTIVNSAGGVTGTYAGATSSLPYLIASLSYDANDVFLTLTRDTLFFQHQAATPNERAVAGALDRFATDNPLFLAAAGLTGAATRQALDALSGEIHASVQTTLLDNSRFMRLAMLGRLRQAAFAGAPDATAVLGYDGPTLAYQAPTPFPVKAAPLAPVKTPDFAFWTQAVGAWGSFDGDGNAASLTRNLGGFFSGFDARFGEFSRVGLAGGYTRSSLSLGDRASSAGIDTAHLGAYAGTGFGAFNLRAGAAFAFHTIDTSRTIQFPGFFDKTAAHYDGGTGQIFGEAGYGMAFGNVAVEPFAGAAWVHVKTDSFAETGGLAALNGGAATDSVGYSSLGVRFATSYLMPNGTMLTPRATLAWQHAFNAVTPATALAFQINGIGFGVAGVPIARDAALIDAGFDLRISPQAKLGLFYSGELAATARDHAVKGNFTWNF